MLVPSTPQKSSLDDVIASQEDYIYNPIGKRDPFRMPQVLICDPVIPVDGHSVSGVIWDNEQPQALVSDSAGRSFVVAEGQLLGESLGLVTRISEEGVEVSTAYHTLDGDRVEATTVLSLPSSATP